MELGHELGTWSRESKRSARAERGPEGKCVDTAGGRALAARGGLHRLLHALFGTVPEAHRRETRRGAVCAAQQRGAGRLRRTQYEPGRSASGAVSGSAERQRVRAQRQEDRTGRIKYVRNDASMVDLDDAMADAACWIWGRSVAARVSRHVTRQSPETPIRSS